MSNDTTPGRHPRVLGQSWTMLSLNSPNYAVLAAHMDPSVLQTVPVINGAIPVKHELIRNIARSRR